MDNDNDFRNTPFDLFNHNFTHHLPETTTFQRLSALEHDPQGFATGSSFAH
jgi:hypothetical protein